MTNQISEEHTLAPEDITKTAVEEMQMRGWDVDYGIGNVWVFEDDHQRSEFEADLTEILEALTSDDGRIMKALRTYNSCKGNALYHVSDADAKDHHFGTLQGLVDLEEEQRLLDEGAKYHAQGYRLKSSKHQMRGSVIFTIPKHALCSEIVSAGYIGTSEKVRLEYLVQIKTTS